MAKSFLERAALMLFYLVICVLQTGVCNPCDTAAHPVKNDFAWGANGHALNQGAYGGNLDWQMEILKNAGLSFYRVDMANDENGMIRPNARARFDELLEKARENDITIVPILFPPDRKKLYEYADLKQAYELGFAIGSGFASRYGKSFTYYELGNENEIELIDRPPGDGADTSQYDMPKLKSLAAVLRGMSDGIKSVDTAARIIISNSGWLHFAYFDLLEAEGVHFDIIGYHWYDDVSTLRDVLRVLKNYYGSKPVWFTEINIRDGASKEHAPLQRGRMKQYLRLISRSGKNIKGFFVYELMDQPDSNSPTERHYGIVTWSKPFESFTYRSFVDLIRKAVERQQSKH